MESIKKLFRLTWWTRLLFIKGVIQKYVDKKGPFGWSTKCWFILWVYSKKTKVISKNFLVKSSENIFIFSVAFNLVMCLMKPPKNFEKIVILKTRELVSFEGVKTHFGKLSLKWCIFKYEKKKYPTLCCSF